MFAQMYFKCQWAYWLFLFMHAMPSWIIHTTFYEEPHQSHLRTLAPLSQNTGQTITMLDSIAEIYTWHNGLNIFKKKKWFRWCATSCQRRNTTCQGKKWPGLIQASQPGLLVKSFEELLGSPAWSGRSRVICVTHGGVRAVIYVQRSSGTLVCNEVREGGLATSTESRDPRWPRSIIHTLEYGAHQTLASFLPKKKSENLFSLTPY